MHLARLEAQDDAEGWRAQARRLAQARVPAQDVLWQVGDEGEDLFSGLPSAPPRVGNTPPLTVPKAFVDLAGQALLHSDPERFALLYALLLRVAERPRLMDDRADPLIRRVEHLASGVRRDIHKMRAFVRFREIDGRFVAWFEPDHHILRTNAAFFVDRFATMPWSILTPRGTLHWDTQSLTEGPPARRGDAPAGDPVEAVWTSYYAAIFNPARLMTRAMLKEMPRKYWKNMPETALVPGLIAGARKRELAMITQAQSAPRAHGPASLELLREEAAGCQRCGLCRPATQTVFGEGPRDAAIMIVGEQPGDMEDLAGKPFVGPAGAVFDRAMTAAGLTRAETYVTNAVKHFKFEQRGKLRLHARPNAGEIEACRWWLDQERAIVRPRLVIAMGASAARALTGRPVTIGRERGHAIALPDGTPCWITIHPSALLRLPPEADKQVEFERYAADLTRAAQSLAADEAKHP